MNRYLDHLLELVEPDGSFTRKSFGVTETGFADVERAALLALVVELRALRETLGSLERSTPIVHVPRRDQAPAP